MQRIAWFYSLLLGVTLQAQGVLKIATGITPAQNIFNLVQPAFEKATGIKLVLIDARSAAAWDLLDKGTVDAAAGGLTWEEWIRSIQAKGLRVPAAGEIRQFQIGTDQIQVLLHGETLLMTLDKIQLKGIFTGALRNWKEVGGDDGAIQVILDANQIATNDTFRAQILDGEAFRRDTLPVAPGRTVLQTVDGTPRSVGFAPKASVRSLTVNSPITPNVTRPILLLIKGQTPAPGIQTLLTFLASPEGQKLVVN